MSFSEKQKLYLEYLLKLIGFNNEANMLYSNLLLKRFSKVIYEPGHWYISYDDCFKILKQEIELKQYNIINAKTIVASINATDLSSYIFCPASFSISKTFIIEYPTNSEELELGTDYHSKLITAKKRYYKRLDTSELSKKEIDNMVTLSNIRKSKLIYSGHTQRKPFFNETENFYGDPDYVFLNIQNESFIVEEKFSYRLDPGKEESGHHDFSEYKRAYERNKEWQIKKTNFFKNHIVQLYSYIRNYPVKISHGYLIYWYYDFNGEDMYIHKFDIKEIRINEEYEDLYQKTKKYIGEIKSVGEVKFDNTAVNLNKCVRCSVNKYCGHKTQHYSTLSFPYKKFFLKLFPLVEFPKELIKRVDDNDDKI